MKGIYRRVFLPLTMCAVILILSGVCGSILQSASGRSISDGYIAFSLREAQTRISAGGGSSPEIKLLAGITRIVGMVHDRDNKDVILIGKRVELLPAATMDNLVVALRALLVDGIWPRVSIDPTPETALTGRQKVVLDECLVDTEFGKRFLDCDIILKNYSLGLSGVIADVEPYKTTCRKKLKSKLGSLGHAVHSEQWKSSADAKEMILEHYGRKILDRVNFQCRFWFRPDTDRFLPVERNGVYVIKKLCLQVAREYGQGDNVPGGADYIREAGREAADDFCARFTEHFPEMAQRNPDFEWLETLYAMTAVAGAIVRLDEIPDLNYLLYEYRIPVVETARHHDWIRQYGVFSYSGGNACLMEISGGIELRTLIRRLGEGDVDAMKRIVLDTRPTARSVSWVVPLTEWEIPNDSYCQELDAEIPDEDDRAVEGGARKIGFTMTTDAYVLAPRQIVPSYTSRPDIKLYVTDFGIRQWDAGLEMFDDFSKTSHIVPHLDKRGQILIVMPADKDFPRNRAEHDKLTMDIFTGLKQRIAERGLDTYEIQLIENVNALGYFNDNRQRMVTEFGKDVLNALTMLRDHLEGNESSVEVHGIFASNGGNLVTKALADMEPGLFDKLDLVSARASRSDVIKAFDRVGEMRIFNEAGDAPAGGPGIPMADHLVANHETAKELTETLPGLELYWIDPKGWNLYIKSGGLFPEHTKSLRNPPVRYKKYENGAYTETRKASGWELFSGVRNEFLGFSIPPTPLEMSHDANSIPYIPGDKTTSDDRGGVRIVVDPKSQRKDLDSLKAKILKSKSAGDSLFWDFKKPKRK